MKCVCVCMCVGVRGVICMIMPFLLVDIYNKRRTNKRECLKESAVPVTLRMVHCKSEMWVYIKGVLFGLSALIAVWP